MSSQDGPEYGRHRSTDVGTDVGTGAASPRRSVLVRVGRVATMAAQALYRRYRPGRFGDVKGQDHVVRALRSAVAEGREGQAYLFSGPRGTGKTSCARILAKALNCQNLSDGEPCGVCESCVSVERGISYDVHELDAASNNGVDAMRDLIEKASLGTPGRHKVYILDEVHMLSKAAEAALLKTLEEPPPHVVFVLATTDPQKVSDTIISRTQHLQFHLLPADTLLEHVRWVAGDAGLDVSDAALEQVLLRGGGSARDTLSALELVASTGGDGVDVLPLGDLVEAMIERDPGQGLRAVATATQLGADARSVTESLIAHLRNGFLALMAPDLVQVPAAQRDEIAAQAQRLGPAAIVRGIETLGTSLVEMRHSPDPRILLDVAIVRLTADDAADDVSALAARLERLEHRVASAPAAAPAASPPVDPGTGRAVVGGRARRVASETPDVASTDVPPTPSVEGPGAGGAGRPGAVGPAASDVEPTGVLTSDGWDAVRTGLRGMARAVYTPATFVACTPTTLTLSVPNDVHRAKCEQHRNTVETQLAARGSAVTIELLVGDADRAANAGRGDGPGTPSASEPSATPSGREPAASSSPASAPQAAASGTAASGAASVADDLVDDDDVDLDDLVDAPPDSVKSPLDRLAEAFPGSVLIEEQDGAGTQRAPSR
jgi:DNA polymerase-3 subunit gamma/tau